jgi:cytochrome c-type biogenesis protein CcmH
MTSFWLIIGAMLALAAAAALLPIWFARSRSDISQSEINTRIFRERLADLDRELRELRIDQQQYQQLRTELERTLLIDVPQNETGPQPAKPEATRWLGTAVTALILLLALGYYYTTAYRGEAQQWMQVQAQLENTVMQAIRNPETLPDEALQDLPNFTRVLQAKVLREGMNDPDTLLLLGISLLQLEVPDGALSILHRAHQLAPQRTDIMLGYAQAMLLTNDGKLTPASARMLYSVLQIEPNHQGALMMLGFGAFNSGNYDIAIKAWQPLLTAMDPNSEIVGLLKNSIDQARQRLAQPAASPSSTEENATSATTSARIDVTVTLAPELTDKLTPNDTLFIFAKAASGPPMPLAAVRQQATGFPVQVVLDDSKAMMPSMKLSNFQEVIVGARISKAGDVLAKPGDLESLSQPLRLANEPLSVSLTIDQVVQ